MDNLALTDASGNSKNKIAKRYYIRKDGIHIGKDVIRGNIRVNGISASKTFTTTQDAELWVNEQKKI